MFIHWQSTAKTRVRGGDFSWFWKLKLRFLGASSTGMRRYMNVEIHHWTIQSSWRKGQGTLSTCKAVFTPDTSCCEVMTCLPSPLYFSFFLCILGPWPWKLFTSPLRTMTLLSSPSWSLFAQSFWCVSASLANGHEQWGVQIPAAFTGTGHTPVQLEPAGLGFSECSCGGAGYGPIETCLVAQPCLPQGGVKNRNCLWKFTDWRPHDFLLNLKIPSIIFLNQLCSLSLFTSILQGQRYFLSVTPVHLLP